MKLNSGVVSLTAVVFLAITLVCAICIVLYTISSLSKIKKSINYDDKILLFGVPVTPNDFISIIQTLGAYLKSSVDNTIDLKDFIDEELLRYPGIDGNFTLIERCLNQLPLVACIHMGKGKYVVDEKTLVKKYEKYQKQTQRDDYILPLFQADVVSRNPNLFNFATKYQHNETTAIILRSDIMNMVLAKTEDIINKINEDCDRNYIKDLVPIYPDYSELETCDEDDYYENEEYYDESEYYDEDEDFIEGQIDIFEYANEHGFVLEEAS